MASRRVEDLNPLLAQAYAAAKSKWLKLYPQAPIPILTCTYRSREEQAELYAQSRTKPGPKVTNAKPGQSAHNYRPAWAFDVAFDKAGKTDWSDKWFNLFAPLVLETPGITWGGNFKSFKDRPHFEVTGWKDKLAEKVIAVATPAQPSKNQPVKEEAKKKNA